MDPVNTKHLYNIYTMFNQRRYTNGQLLWSNVLYVQCRQACLHDKIRLGNSASLDVFLSHKHFNQFCHIIIVVIVKCMLTCSLIFCYWHYS